MATTAQQVFDLAMRLMDNVDLSGNTDFSGNTEYKIKTVGILNVLTAECYPLSDTYSAEATGKKPVPALLTDLADEIPLDDILCRSVLPYGLAAHLLLDEDSGKAAFFNNRYEQLKAELKNAPGEFEPIENVYGGIEYRYYC